MTGSANVGVSAGANPEHLLPKFKELDEDCDLCGLQPGELEWIEEHAVENMKARVETATVLARESEHTLLLVLTGTAGALAYGVQVLDGKLSNSTIAAAAACIWLMAVSAYLVLRCMKIGPVPAIYSHPETLCKRFQLNVPHEEWRTMVILKMEPRINSLIARNERVAKALNLARLAALLTPLVAVFAVLIQKLIVR
ncbi:hypothetical protein [Hydrogenophaga taeniospiralis]|uniref:hypothetical protein n=1 Tax=Hydrogenophaga taeniospiralis TaxID=65656 RepID=UPI001CFB0019|nr:hypothetical protein [Hydrogenophaga taeniospiralis]UCU95227.1 hypothetical protein KI616_05035 [Hydrogenophaga taeniospiralis]